VLKKAYQNYSLLKLESIQHVGGNTVAARRE
jgi:hypothetical protein